MNRNGWLSLLVALSVAPLGCTPTLSTQGQFVEGGGATDGSGLTSAWEEAETASAIWTVTCPNTP